MKKVFSSAMLIFALTIYLVGCGSSQKVLPETLSAIRVSAINSDAAEPAIAVDENKNIYVVYVEHNADKSADVFLQKFNSSKQPVADKTRINPVKGQVKAWFGDSPTIKIGADGAIYVGWTARVESAQKSSATDLFVSVSRDGGKTFGTPVKVNDDIAPASHGMHSLAIGKDNSVYVAWLDERSLESKPLAESFNSSEPEFQFVKAHHNSNENRQAETKKIEKPIEPAEPNSEVFFAASTDGGKTFAPNVRISSEVCPCCKTNLLVTADGRIYASWRQVLSGDFRHIAVASSVDAGKTFSAPTIVSDDQWKINACPVSGAALAIDKNNFLKIAWFTAGAAGKSGLYEAESNNAGATFSDRVLVSETKVAGTPIFAANENGNFKIFWEADEKIYQSESNHNSAQTTISDGSLPSAAAVGEKVVVAFIKKENDKRSIWLTELK